MFVHVSAGIAFSCCCRKLWPKDAPAGRSCHVPGWRGLLCSLSVGLLFVLAAAIIIGVLLVNGALLKPDRDMRRSVRSQLVEPMRRFNATVVEVNVDDILTQIGSSLGANFACETALGSEYMRSAQYSGSLSLSELAAQSSGAFSYTLYLFRTWNEYSGRPSSEACAEFRALRARFRSEIVQLMDEANVDVLAFPPWNQFPRRLSEGGLSSGAFALVDLASTAGLPNINVPSGTRIPDAALPVGVTFLCRTEEQCFEVAAWAAQPLGPRLTPSL